MADDLNKDLSRSEKLLKDRLTAAGKVARDITNKAFRELINSVNEYSRSLDSITSALEDQLDIYNELKVGAKVFGQTLKSTLPFIKDNKDLSQKLVGIYKDQNTLIDKLVRNQEDLVTGELSSKKVNDDLLKVKIQGQNILLRQNDISKEILQTQNDLVGTSGQEKEDLEFKIAALQEINQELNTEKENLAGISANLSDQAKSAQKIENRIGVGGKLLNAFKKIPVLGDLLDVEGAEKAMRATAAQGGGYFKTLGSGISALGPSLMKALGPLALIDLAVKAIQFVIDAMFAADERVTKLAKGMMLTKDEARGVYNSLKDTKLEMDSIYNTTKDVTEAFTDLIELTEFVTSATNEMVESQIILTKNLGLSKEEAFGVQEAFVASNVEANIGKDIVYDQIAAFANQNKLISTGKKIFADIAKTSKLIQINFNGNLGSLVKTTLEAKKLGLTLDQVSKIGSSLLDFEQSISSELEAELLTGKDLNLEKARSYALNHDIAGLTQEIANQGITQEKFAAMNVIQQEAMAKSLGMSADEMGDMLYKGKVLNKVGGDTLKNLRERAKVSGDINLQNKVAALEQGILSGKSLEEAEKSTSAQEKFNQALEQAKEIFTDFVDGGFLDMLADAIKSFADMMLSTEDKEKAAAKRGEEMKNSEEYKKYTPEQQKYIDEQQKIVEENQVGIGGKFISLLSPDFMGMDYYGDVEKYGKSASEKLSQIKSKGFEGKTTNINAKDFVIKTLPEDTVVAAGGTSLGNSKEMVQLLTEQNQLLAGILNKEGTIVLNGTKMGTAMAVGSYRTQ